MLNRTRVSHPPGVPGPQLCWNDSPALRRASHNCRPGNLGKRDGVRLFQLRRRPPACEQRGRRPPIIPPSDRAARATLGRRRRSRKPGMKSHPPERHTFSRIRVPRRYVTDGQARCPPPQPSQTTSKLHPESAARATLGHRRRTRRPEMRNWVRQAIDWVRSRKRIRPRPRPRIRPRNRAKVEYSPQRRRP